MLKHLLVYASIVILVQQAHPCVYTAAHEQQLAGGAACRCMLRCARQHTSRCTSGGQLPADCTNTGFSSGKLHEKLHGRMAAT